jgi:hypothetical protein
MGISQTLENGVMGWLKRIKGAKYTNVSPRTFDKLLRSGLRHVKLPSGTILTRPDWIDEFLKGFEVEAKNDPIDELVNEIMDEMDNS